MTKFGRLPAPDIRDLAHPMRLALDFEAPLPPYKYWVPGAIQNQGLYGVCVGAAWNGWMRCSPTRTVDGPDMQAIYRAAIAIDEWAENDNDVEMQFGTSVRAGAKVLADQNRIAEYLWATDMAAMRRWLLTKGSVVMGTSWYSGMMDVDSSGYVNLTGSVEGGHAWCAIGYTSTGHRFRCINSWGSGWGQKGRFWVREDDMARLLAEDGEGCTAVERKP